jgi:sulfopyruvate decarboxylase TPP-binding subunit
MKSHPFPGMLGGMANNSDTSTVRKPGAGVEARQLLAVHIREPQRLLASVRLRMSSGLEADLPEGLAVEDIVRIINELDRACLG